MKSLKSYKELWDRLKETYELSIPPSQVYFHKKLTHLTLSKLLWKSMTDFLKEWQNTLKESTTLGLNFTKKNKRFHYSFIFSFFMAWFCLNSNKYTKFKSTNYYVQYEARRFNFKIKSWKLKINCISFQQATILTKINHNTKYCNHNQLTKSHFLNNKKQQTI